jgi:hypothetical protein
MGLVKYLLALLLILIPVTSLADTHNAASCSNTDITSAITAAAAGDTVTVPAGNCTWTDNIHITKALTIIGAGIGNTNITGSFTATNSWDLSPEKYHIAIVPATPADNPVIRISGFTFTFGTGAHGIFYRNTKTDGTELTKVRLDHLSIYSPPGKYVFYRYGLAHGVMDHCIINGRMDMGGAAALWSNTDYAYGTNSNFYFEDNTWTAEAAANIEMQSGNGAGRYAFRYNTITTPTNYRAYPIFDLHGNQYNVRASGFGAEIYGNDITANAPSGTTVSLVRQRGGKFLLFNNKISYSAGDGVSAAILEEHLDSDGLGNATSPNGQPQYVSSTYYWTNPVNGTELVPTLIDSLSIGIPVENTHVWLKKSSFDGSVGMGCGTLASRPATCTTGTAYWATTQSCTDMTGMVGKNPATPISGSLYKCVDNAWEETASYTPYTYPHPLRTEEDADPMVVSVYVNGAIMTINFSKPITSADNAGFTLDPSGADVTVDCPAVETAATSMACTISRALVQSETATYAYSDTKVIDEASNALANIGTTAITGNLTPAEAPTSNLLVTKTGSGCTVTSSPSGILVSGATASDDFDFNTNTAVTLSGYSENGWNAITYGGDCAANGTVTMSTGGKTCTATCTQVQLFP